MKIIIWYDLQMNVAAQNRVSKIIKVASRVCKKNMQTQKNSDFTNYNELFVKKTQKNQLKSNLPLRFSLECNTNSSQSLVMSSQCTSLLV